MMRIWARVKPVGRTGDGVFVDSAWIGWATAGNVFFDEANFAAG